MQNTQRRNYIAKAIVTFVLLSFFALTAHSQVISPSVALNRSMYGPTVEKYMRDAYAPVDFYRNNGGGNFAYPINQDQGYANGYGPGYYGPGYGQAGYGGSKTDRVVAGGIVGGTVGGVIGGIVGGRRGAWYGAGAGAAVGVTAGLLASNGNGKPVAGPGAGGGGQKEGEFEIANNTPFSTELYLIDGKKEKYIGRIAPGGSKSVKGPKPNQAYVGYELVPNERGGLSNFRIFPKPMQGGWIFEAPSPLARKGDRY